MLPDGFYYGPDLLCLLATIHGGNSHCFFAVSCTLAELFTGSVAITGLPRQRSGLGVSLSSLGMIGPRRLSDHAGQSPWRKSAQQERRKPMSLPWQH